MNMIRSEKGADSHSVQAVDESLSIREEREDVVTESRAGKGAWDPVKVKGLFEMLSDPAIVCQSAEAFPLLIIIVAKCLCSGDSSCKIQLSGLSKRLGVSNATLTKHNHKLQEERLVFATRTSRGIIFRLADCFMVRGLDAVENSYIPATSQGTPPDIWATLVYDMQARIRRLEKEVMV